MDKRLLYSLLGLNGLFIILHLASHAIERLTNSPLGAALTPWLSMDIEYSLPSWFAAILLLSIAISFALLGKQKQTHRLAWFSLSAIFLYLSSDELFAIHENLIDPMQETFGITSGPLFFAWIIPVSAIILILGAIYFRFFLSLPINLRNTLFLAAGLFVLGAIGIEMISGAYWQAHQFDNDMTYRLLNALEEGLENTGSIIALTALVTHQSKQS